MATASASISRGSASDADRAREQGAKAARGAEGSGGEKMAGREPGASYTRSPDGTVTPIARGGYGDMLFGGRPGTDFEGKSYRASDVNDYLGMGDSTLDSIGNFFGGMVGLNELDPRQFGASQPGMGADYGFDAIGSALGLLTGVPGTAALYRGLTGGSTDINLGPNILGGATDIVGGLDRYGGGTGTTAAQRSMAGQNNSDSGQNAFERALANLQKQRADERARQAAEEAAAQDDPDGDADDPVVPVTPESWYTLRQPGMAGGGAVYATNVQDYIGNVGLPRLDRWYSPGSTWKPSLYYDNNLGALPADYRPTNVVTWGAGERVGPGIHNPTSTPGNPTGTNPTTPPPSTGGGDDDDDEGGLPSWSQIQQWLKGGWRPTQQQVRDYIGAGGTIPGRGKSGSGSLGNWDVWRGMQDGGYVDLPLVDRMVPEEMPVTPRFGADGTAAWPMQPTADVPDAAWPMPFLPPKTPLPRRAFLDKGERDMAKKMLAIHGRVVAPGGGRDDMGIARHVSGEPIALADGEYVVPADVVAAMGEGSTDQGARVLDRQVVDMRNREAKRLKSLPPPKR